MQIGIVNYYFDIPAVQYSEEFPSGLLSMFNEVMTPTKLSDSKEKRLCERKMKYVQARQYYP